MGIRELATAERSDFVDFLRTLSDDDWERPSLCDGWRVRDVVAHMSTDSVSLGRYVATAVTRPSADRLNGHFVDAARDIPIPALIDRMASVAERGWFGRLMPSVALSDAVVHHQDIRRPLGRPRTIDTERLLHTLSHPDPFAYPRRYTRGLRFVATDLDWVKGSGPQVRGTGEVLALAIVGRRAVLDELEGDGVDVLAKRIRGPRSSG